MNPLVLLDFKLGVELGFEADAAFQIRRYSPRVRTEAASPKSESAFRELFSAFVIDNERGRNADGIRFVVLGNLDIDIDNGGSGTAELVSHRNFCAIGVAFRSLCLSPEERANSEKPNEKKKSEVHSSKTLWHFIIF